jgi:hypothetical protein
VRGLCAPSLKKGDKHEQKHRSFDAFTYCHFCILHIRCACFFLPRSQKEKVGGVPEGVSLKEIKLYI